MSNIVQCHTNIVNIITQHEIKQILTSKFKLSV